MTRGSAFPPPTNPLTDGTPHRRLRIDRQCAHGGARAPRRLDRLAVPAALRFARVFRRAAGERRERPMDRGAGRSAGANLAPLCPGTAILETRFEAAGGAVT